MTALILAHQGGWDELLLVAGPVALIALLLVLADRRAKRALGEQAGTPAGGEAGDGPARGDETARGDGTAGGDGIAASAEGPDEPAGGPGATSG